MKKIDELRDAYEATTGGEWEVKQGPYQLHSIIVPGRYVCEARDVEDSNFIALAHNLMPALLEAVELLKEISEWATKNNVTIGDEMRNQHAACILEKLK